MENKNQKLNEIAKEVASCKKCSLYKNTTRSVPGEGNPEAEIMFIGEGPGYWEDQRGVPFCGAAGKLLDELLAAIKIERKSVFIGNVVKHRPPENREPMPEEIEACRDFLDRQIEIIQPKLIVTLGRFSMMKFIPNGKISQIHGLARTIEFNNRKLMVLPMYHPAAALRRGEVMKDLKKDFTKIPPILAGKPINVSKTGSEIINNSNKEKKVEELQLPLI